MHSFPSAPDNVLAVRIEGKVDAADIRATYDRLDAVMERAGDIGIAVDMTRFDDATADAIDTDLKRELSLLGDLPRFKRMALVTDKEWIGHAAEWAGKLVPTTEMRIFGPGDMDAAIAWAGGA